MKAELDIFIYNKEELYVIKLIAGKFPFNYCWKDKNVAKILGVELKFYRNYLIENFNAEFLPVASYYDGEKDCSLHNMCFHNKKDIENAITWIDSLIVINSLKRGIS